MVWYARPDIEASLDDPLADAPLPTMRRQIAELGAQALNAQRLSLQYPVEMIAADSD